MAFLSDKLGKIKPSPGLELTRKVTEMKAEGKDVIGLGVGESNFETPDHIKEAGIKAIRDGKTRYTTVDGTIECKRAVALRGRAGGTNETRAPSGSALSRDRHVFDHFV